MRWRPDHLDMPRSQPHPDKMRPRHTTYASHAPRSHWAKAAQLVTVIKECTGDDKAWKQPSTKNNCHLDG